MRVRVRVRVRGRARVRVRVRLRRRLGAQLAALPLVVVLAQVDVGEEARLGGVGEM